MCVLMMNCQGGLTHYLNPAESVEELRKGIDTFMQFYNYKRPHQSLEELLPCMRYGVAA